MDRRKFFKLGLGVGAVSGSITGAMARQTHSRRSFVRTVVSKDRTQLFVRDWGEGEPVLFLAGWTLSSDFWRYQMLSLERHGYRALAYDRRGHGRSDDPGGGYDFDTLADDLASVIEVCTHDKITIVGHSMAAGEITRYFTRNGGRKLEKVILVGPTTPFLMRTPDNPHGIDPALFEAARAKLALDFPGLIDAQIGAFFTPKTASGTVDWVKRMMMETSMQAVVELAKALQETDFRKELPAINIPALVVHGDIDASAPLPLTGSRTAELMPNARLLIVDGAPHGLPITHVERLNREIHEFLATR